jgi:H+/Cl- antiporter ClcA
LAQVVLISAIAGGFGSVFGVPVGGVMFALETSGLIWTRRNRRIDVPLGRSRSSPLLFWSLIGSVIAALAGQLVVEGLHYEHVERPRFGYPVGGIEVVRLVGLGLALGLAARAFVVIKDLADRSSRRWWPDPTRRLFAAGAVLTVLLLLAGPAYRNLSLGLIERSLTEVPPPTLAFAIKLGLTALAVGCGFPGGEVTPLFAVGASLGATLAQVTGAPQVPFASLGMVTVFSVASRAPLCAIAMAWEIFGTPAVVPPMTVVVALAMVLAPRRGLYAVTTESTPTVAEGESSSD